MALARTASHDVIASEQQLADLIRQIDAADRIALDTEADSLHSYREKLCLLQISAPAGVILSNVEGSRGTASKVALRDSSTSLGMTEHHDFTVKMIRTAAGTSSATQSALLPVMSR